VAIAALTAATEAEYSGSIVATAAKHK